MLYLSLKTLHNLSMLLLFGTGLGSAFYKWMADRSGNLAHIAVTNRHVVLADWLFTTPTVIFQPISGLAMASLAGYSLRSDWIAISLALYVFAGACWLPVVWLQIRVRDLARAALAAGEPISPLAERLMRWWFCLGWPAFVALIVVFYLLVSRPG